MMNKFLLILLSCMGLQMAVARQLPMKVKEVGQQVKPIPLQDVRLLESPFKHAMDKDVAWLLSLSPDRFLHRFRLNAGLAPKGEIYGGWESRGVSGHSLGHYLSACAMAYAASGDERFKDKVDYIIAQLAECQQARKTGYIGGIPDEDKIWDEVAAGNIRSQGFDLNGGWVPWYTEHKVLAGLIDAYRYANSKTALQIASKFADWIDDKFKNLSEAQFQKMLDCEHGGMNESLADLYAYTGNKKYLDLSFRFDHQKILDPLAAGKDELAGKHANTQVPKVIGAARQYALTGDDKSKRISTYFWDEVVHHHSYVIGGNSDFEHFGPADSLSKRLSTNTTETCNSYNMLKLTRQLFFRDPKASYMDYYERTLYNHILASQNPDDGMTCYYVPLVSGGEKVYGTPTESFWCCTGTGMENHVKYGESIYFEGLDGSLYVNLFIPSVLSWSETGAVVKMETDFPASEEVKITIEKTGKNKSFPVRIRYPQWAAGMQLKINGVATPVDTQPGSYMTLARKWKAGDEIQLILPMQLHQEAMPDNANKIAMLYGPLVLAGGLGTKGLEPTEIPVFVHDGQSLASWVKPAGTSPLTFAAVGQGGQPVSMIPFYQMHHQKYAVYWDNFTDAQWAVRKEAFEKEQLRLADERRRTVDEMRIGEMQPERDHHLSSENSHTGEAMGKKWRDANQGGWFAFDMQVVDHTPLSLVCTYFGSDNGRVFDIFVNDEKIATQRLTAQKPNQFFDVSYTIPTHLVHDRKTIRVKFQAAADQIAGGLFGCKVLRKADDGQPAMYFTDTTSGKPIAKDPKIVRFKGKYWMYYSIPGKANAGWHIGVAQSDNLFDWHKVGELHGEADYEKNGLCAPGALVRGDTVHLFYQTYGNGPKDAICHAYSTDGVHFIRDTSNPIFKPTGNWNSGRAIDAEVAFYKQQYFLYFATRDPKGEIQMQGVATAPAGTDFNRTDWKQATDRPILRPTLPWEGKCIEAASVIERNGMLYMFYAGSYNNAPQQIGLAKSTDGIHWERVQQTPFLANGKASEWNASESGHPDIFKAADGKYYLFFQGNRTGDGQSWYLSNHLLQWEGNLPQLVE